MHVIQPSRVFPLGLILGAGVALAAVLISSTGCGGSPSTEVSAIRLIDRFDPDKLAGSPQGLAGEPAALWDFKSGSAPAGGDTPATLGWTAGPGVTGLRVADGRLTGRSTTDFPVIYAKRPEAVDPNDTLYSLDVRIRASGGANINASGMPPIVSEWAPALGLARVFPWPISSPLRSGEEFQNLSMQPARSTVLRTAGMIAIRPVDVAGATFEIESVRMVSQKEHRESIPSGIGWNGLSEIYRETIVSRSPEQFRIELDVPRNAWLDLNVGALENDPITFKITASSGGGEKTVLERTVTTPHRWEPAPVDLAGHAGRTTLTFSLGVEKERRVGYWGSPVIRVRNAKPHAAQTAGAALGGVEPPQGVILIMCDTLRADHLNMYGHGRETAPHLADTASRGALFLDTVSQATWTKVATPSIMTSLFPTSHRIADFFDRLPASATTLAELYHDAGFATVSMSSVAFTGKMTNLHQGFDELHEATSFQDEQYSAKSAREYVDRASAWIERHRDTPFFMFLHVFDPHDPFRPRPPYDALWADPAKREHHEKQLEDVKKVIEDPLMKMFGMPSRVEMEKAGIDAHEFVEHDKDWYDGSIRGMDAEMGRLFGRLRELGLEGKVQIAFISDHGEEFIEHGRMFHGQTVYGELASVPLMLYRPGTIPPGLRIAETVRSIDLMPTLLDLSGLAAPAGIQGQSLVPLIAAANKAGRGGAQAAGGPLTEAAGKLGWKPLPAVTEKAKTTAGGGPPPRGSEMFGLVLDGWKIVHHTVRFDGGPEYELFDHANDPLDKTDVASQHPEIVEKLKAELASWREMVDAGKLPDGGSTENLSPEELKRLRSLGYIK